MTRPDPPGGLGYAAAGVDAGAGDRAVELIREHVARTTRPEVIGGIGGFAGWPPTGGRCWPHRPTAWAPRW